MLPLRSNLTSHGAQLLRLIALLSVSACSAKPGVAPNSANAPTPIPQIAALDSSSSNESPPPAWRAVAPTESAPEESVTPASEQACLAPLSVSTKSGLCEQLAHFDWRVYTLNLQSWMEARSYVTKTRTNKNYSYDHLVAAERAWHMVVMDSHRRPPAVSAQTLIEELVELHSRLANLPSRGRGDSMFAQDMARYYEALDTEQLLCDGTQARSLWQHLLHHPTGTWVGAIGTRWPGPDDIDAYLASAQIALALNYRDVMPANRETSRALLEEVIESGKGKKILPTYMQAALCFFAESEAERGQDETAVSLYKKLRKYMRGAKRASMLEARIDILAR